MDGSNQSSAAATGPSTSRSEESEVNVDHSQGDFSSAESNQLQKQNSGQQQKDEGLQTQVYLLIRSPDNICDLNLKADLGWTVAQLKDIIQQKCDSHPAVNEQVLIHAGKVLKDPGASLREVLRTVDGPGPYSMHLVIQNERIGHQNRRGAAAPRGMRTHADRPGGTASGGGHRWGHRRRATHTQDGAFGQASIAVHPAEAERAGMDIPRTDIRGQIAMVPSGTMAVPCMMVSPVVLAAYNAAVAAITNSVTEGRVHVGGGPSQGDCAASSGTGAQSGQQSNPFVFAQNLSDAQRQIHQLSKAWQPQSSQGTGNDAQLLQHNMALWRMPFGAPFIPAMAFFPLCIPMVVPAANSPQHLPYQMYPTSTSARYVQMEGGRFIYADPARQQGQVNTHQMRRMQNQNRGGRRRRVVMFRISLQALLQLVLMLTVIYSYFSTLWFFLIVGFLLLWGVSANPLQRLLNHLSGRNLRHANRGDQNPHENQDQRRGFVMELLTLVVGFITSLVPGWNINAQDDAAFADAQEMMMREEEGGREPNANGNAVGNVEANGAGENQLLDQQWVQQNNQERRHEHQD